jgi:hypothetical protein
MEGSGAVFGRDARLWRCFRARWRVLALFSGGIEGSGAGVLILLSGGMGGSGTAQSVFGRKGWFCQTWDGGL